eukprot:jgi/Tetstr1/455199/TSEL_042049.t1
MAKASVSLRPLLALSLFLLVAAQELPVPVVVLDLDTLVTTRSGGGGGLGVADEDPRIEEFLKQRTQEFQDSKEATKAVEARLRGPDTSVRTGGPRPIRFHLDYDQMNDFGDAALAQKLALVRDEIMPLAAADLSSRLLVRAPPSDKLYLPSPCKNSYTVDGETLCTEYRRNYDNPGWCYEPDGIRHESKYFGNYELCTAPSQDSCTTTSGGEGVEDKDIIIYVIADQANCNGEYAHALACEFDTDTNRPLAGGINFCPNAFGVDSDPKRVAAVAVHEMLHVLFFSTWLVQYQFIGESGEGYTHAERYTTDVHGRTVLKTPKVQEVARDYFGCPSAEGMALEDGGSLSHWESSTLRGDVMGPVADGTGKANIGPLTAAMAEDSGWYFVNWENVTPNSYGYKAGCDFLTHTCTDFVAAHPSQKYFCPPGDSGFRCSDDNMFVATCLADPTFHPECAVPKSVLVYNAGNIITNNCYDPSMQTLNNGILGNFFGANSRCMDIRGSMKSPEGYNLPWPRCLKMSCTATGMLQLDLGSGTKVDCPTGEDVVLSGTAGWVGTFGPCPDNTETCAGLTCPNDCSGNGVCMGGECACFLSYIGSDCSTEICTPGHCGGECPHPRSLPLSHPLSYPKPHSLSHPRSNPRSHPRSYPLSHPLFDPKPHPLSYPLSYLRSHPRSHPLSYPFSFPLSYTKPHPRSYPRSHPLSYPLSHPRSYPKPHPLSHPKPHPLSYPKPHPLSHPRSYPKPHPLSYPKPHPLSYPLFHPRSYPKPHPLSHPRFYPKPHSLSYPQPHPQPHPRCYPLSDT